MSGAHPDSSTGRPSEPPLEAPYYRAPLGAAIRWFTAKSVIFAGRAGRSEFWWCAALLIGIDLAIKGVYHSVGGDEPRFGSPTPTVVTVVTVVSFVWALVTVLPVLSLTFRRLHDSDLSGAWTLLSLIPFVGWVALAILCGRAPRPDGKRFDFVREN